MASGSVKAIKKLQFDYTPSNNLTANSRGYFSVPVPDAIKNKTILATSFGLVYPAAAGGLQLTGAYGGGNNLYFSYFTPIDIQASTAVISIFVTYL